MSASGAQRRRAQQLATEQLRAGGVPFPEVGAALVVTRGLRGLDADGLAATCSPADAELVLRYLQHKAAGDPSPSHTVGDQLGRRPEAVRQAYHRARSRLRRLALADHHFRPLLCLPFLADASEAGREWAA